MEKIIILSLITYLLLSLRFYRKVQGRVYIAPIIPLLIAAGQAGYQIYQSQKQKKEAKKAENYMPPSLLESENIARVQANATRYPGQDQDESAIRQGTADTFANISRSTTSSGDLLNASSALHTFQTRAIQGMAKTGQIFKQNALDRYRGVLAQKAGAQMQSRMYSENLKGAAARNEYNAVNSIAGGVVQAGMTNDWNKTYGNNTNPTMMMYNPMASGMGVQNGGNLMSLYGWNPKLFSSGGNFFNPR